MWTNRDFPQAHSEQRFAVGDVAIVRDRNDWFLNGREVKVYQLTDQLARDGSGRVVRVEYALPSGGACRRSISVGRLEAVLVLARRRAV